MASLTPETGVPRGSRSRALLWWPLLAQLCAVVAVLLVIGLILIYVQASPGADDALGVVIYGVLISAVVGTAVWSVGMTRAARKLFPPGDRLAVVLMSGSATLSLAGVGSLIGGQFDVDLVGEFGVGAIAALLAVATLSVPSLIFRRWDRRLALSRH